MKDPIQEAVNYLESGEDTMVSIPFKFAQSQYYIKVEIGTPAVQSFSVVFVGPDNGYLFPINPQEKGTIEVLMPVTLDGLFSKEFIQECLTWLAHGEVSESFKKRLVHEW